jgi:hypothetical protein
MTLPVFARRGSPPCLRESAHEDHQFIDAARLELLLTDLRKPSARCRRSDALQRLALCFEIGLGVGFVVSRLMCPSQLRIDGVDLSQADPGWLRRNVGVVLQENILFNRSIHDNIAFSNPALNRAQVMAMAKLSGAHEFIAKLPEGYDTMIEERGVCKKDPALPHRKCYRTTSSS